MVQGYEINELAKEESWRMFRIIGELVEGFDRLSDIDGAVTIYGSARVKPGTELFTTTEEIARRLGNLGFTIITGGGPGLMEAANKGAAEAGAISIGLNIEIPKERPNIYATRSISFSHFFVRKIMLVKYAAAFVIMPGGMGTLDELSEVLTLMQTHKIRPFPVILFNSEYWRGFLDWLNDSVLAKGVISEDECQLLRVCDEVDEVVETIRRWRTEHVILGKSAVAG
ncbi:MAG: TIGR00730 family Rossman fold protein [Chloroflexi bacterium]|nr:TIGR00730 family Rossman fold protein [Chloroflexota bacterium]